MWKRVIKEVRYEKRDGNSAWMLWAFLFEGIAAVIEMVSETAETGE